MQPQVIIALQKRSQPEDSETARGGEKLLDADPVLKKELSSAAELEPVGWGNLSDLRQLFEVLIDQGLSEV